jgi:hypothetical protein
MMRMQDVPPAHRFIEAMSVGLLFGDTTQIKCPGDEWINAADAARYVAKKSENFVAYRRFVYDPECGKVYMDPGWVYFKGHKIDKEDIISREAEKKFPGLTIGETLMANVKYNNFDVIWFMEQLKSYPFYEEDVFVDINERRSV